MDINESICGVLSISLTKLFSSEEEVFALDKRTKRSVSQFNLSNETEKMQ